MVRLISSGSTVSHVRLFSRPCTDRVGIRFLTAISATLWLSVGSRAMRRHHAALEQFQRPKRHVRALVSAKNTLKRIKTQRAIKKDPFALKETGVMVEVAFAKNLFMTAA